LVLINIPEDFFKLLIKEQVYYQSALQWAGKDGGWRRLNAALGFKRLYDTFKK
jgi:hypothetical protein